MGDKEKEKTTVAENEAQLNREKARLLNQIDTLEQTQQSKEMALAESMKDLEGKLDSDGIVYQKAQEKYNLNKKTKTARKVAENFATQRSQFENEKTSLVDKMKELQYRYNTDFVQNFVVGLSEISAWEQRKKLLLLISEKSTKIFKMRGTLILKLKRNVNYDSIVKCVKTFFYEFKNGILTKYLE